MDDLKNFCCMNKNCPKHGIRGEKNIRFRDWHGKNGIQKKNLLVDWFPPVDSPRRYDTLPLQSCSRSVVVFPFPCYYADYQPIGPKESTPGRL